MPTSTVRGLRADRRRLLGLCIAAPCAAWPLHPAHALMAGQPPDSPAARVDANLPSSPWSGVVSVVSGGSAFSGVAIAAQHVLTAAHVGAGLAPGQIQVVLNRTGTPQTLAVAAVATYPGSVFPYDDLCVLRLAQPLPGDLAIHPLHDLPTAVGDVFTIVAYGASGLGQAGVSVAGSSAVRRVGRNTLDVLTDRLDNTGRTSAFFLFDFDGPAGNGPFGGPTLGNAMETTLVSGDSGSPAFIDTPMGPALLGLCTFTLALTAGAAPGTFGTGGGGMVLGHAPFLAWLTEQTQGTLQRVSQLRQADVPLAPGWMMAAFGVALGARVLRRHGTARS